MPKPNILGYMAMTPVQTSELPPNALLQQYQLDGAKTDCYFVDLPKQVSHSKYVEAFYTSKLFKLERHILALCARKPSSDEQAKNLAHGKESHFAAWSVEQQTQNQLLLCDFLGKTRSWLMSVPDKNSDTTRVYFGSAVVAKRKSANGEAKVGVLFHALGLFHHVYSKALLRAACSQLMR